MNHHFRIAFCLSALLASSLAFAEVYKWVDANGKVQYGDQPPPAAKSATVKLPGNSVAPQVPSGTGKPSVVEPKKEPALKEAKVTPEEARANCDKLTAHIQSMGDVAYVTGKDAKGKEYDLTSAQMKSALEGYRKDQAYWCGKAGK
ncbi:DUF4124 domain-containing protein [Chitinimonas naiadis]